MSSTPVRERREWRSESTVNTVRATQTRPKPIQKTRRSAGVARPAEIAKARISATVSARPIAPAKSGACESQGPGCEGRQSTEGNVEHAAKGKQLAPEAEQQAAGVDVLKAMFEEDAKPVGFTEAYDPNAEPGELPADMADEVAGDEGEAEA